MDSFQQIKAYVWLFMVGGMKWQQIWPRNALKKLNLTMDGNHRAVSLYNIVLLPPPSKS